MTERWNQAYRDAPEVFDAFSRVEDPEGLVVKHLVARLEPARHAVLEIGAGTGRYTRELAPRALRYVATEPSPALLSRAVQASSGEDISFVRARGEALPLMAASVDAVFAAWVLANLRAKTRARVIGEALRVLRPGGGIWLLENHWQGGFQKLRGRAGTPDQAEVRPLLEDGFRIVERIDTELRFASPEEAQRVLGYLCGPSVNESLRRNPTACVEHAVVLLHRSAT